MDERWIRWWTPVCPVCRRSFATFALLLVWNDQKLRGGRWNILEHSVGHDVIHHDRSFAHLLSARSNKETRNATKYQNKVRTYYEFQWIPEVHTHKTLRKYFMWHIVTCSFHDGSELLAQLSSSLVSCEKSDRIWQRYAGFAMRIYEMLHDAAKARLAFCKRSWPTHWPTSTLELDHYGIVEILTETWTLLQVVWLMYDWCESYIGIQMGY